MEKWSHKTNKFLDSKANEPQDQETPAQQKEALQELRLHEGWKSSMEWLNSKTKTPIKRGSKSKQILPKKGIQMTGKYMKQN